MKKLLCVLKIFYDDYRNLLASLVLIVSIFLFGLTAYKNFDKLIVPYFGSNYDDIVVNIEMPNSIIPIYLYMGQDKGVKKFNSRLKTNSALQITNFYAQTNDLQKYKSLSIMYEDKFDIDLRDYIISSNIFIGASHFYFDREQIRQFELQKVKIGNNYYNKIILPDSLKKIPNSEYMNYKGNYNAIAVILLSFFYLYKVYLIPWILFILGISLIKFERLKIPTAVSLSIITILAVFLRFNLFAEYPMWWDECYTATLTGDFTNPIKDLFMDPGNPPFFALISRFWQIFVPSTIEWLRLLPLIFSVGAIFTLYFLLKSKINKETALLASFLLSISIFHISYAQDYRAFSLSSMLTPLVVYFMFKMLEKMNFLNTFLFILFSSMIFSNHLYGTILLIVNFMYGCWYIATRYQQKFTALKTFIFAHLIIGLTFVPYLIQTFYKLAILDKTFNVWLPDMCFDVFLRSLNAMFGNWQITICLIILSIVFVMSSFYKDKLFWQMSTKQQEFIFYLIYAVFGFLIVTLIISSIRAIIMEYYFMLIYPLCIALIAAMFMLKWRYEFVNIVLSFFLLYSISHMDYNNLQKQFQNVYGSLTQVSNVDALRYKDKNVLVYELIEPTSFREIFDLEPNVIVQSDFNGGNEDFTKYTKKVRLYAKRNPTQFAIFNAWYDEVTFEDREIFENGNFEYIAEFVKTPYYENSGILRVVLLPTK